MLILCTEVNNNSSSLETWVAVSTIIAGIAATVGIIVTIVINNGQNRASKRQLIIPLWEYMSNLREIDSENPITADVIQVANSLELIATLCLNNVVDKEIVMKSFKEQYISHYNNIHNCSKLRGFDNKTGLDILNENPHIQKFYNQLIKTK
jgi:hypothetical protein